MPSGDGNVLTIHTNDGTERFRIDSSGNVKVGSACTISPDGDIFFTGIMTGSASGLAGDASGLTALNATQLTSGTIPDARFPATLPAVSGANLTGINTDLVADTSPQLGGNLDTNDHHILVDDNHYVYYGDSEDLKIGHDGTNSYLQNTTGVLYINNTTGSASNLIVKANDNIELQPANGETGVKAIANGAVELYHNNNKKLETQSDGITCQAEVVTFQSTADVDLILNADTDNSDESHVPTIKFKSDGGTTKLKIGVEGSAGDTFTRSETNTPYIINELNANLQVGTNNTAR